MSIMKLRKALSLLVVLMLLASGLPIQPPEDANRDGLVALDDVIIHIRNLTGASENEGGFVERASNAISSLQAAAGLRTVISGFDHDPYGNPVSGADFPALTAWNSTGEVSRWQLFDCVSDSRFSSHFSPPIVPPPHRT